MTVRTFTTGTFTSSQTSSPAYMQTTPKPTSMPPWVTNTYTNFGYVIAPGALTYGQLWPRSNVNYQN